MPGFRSHSLLISLAWSLLLTPPFTQAGDNAPPSFVPRMVLSYVDPQSGNTIVCDEGCRRFEVPDGVLLRVWVAVRNEGGDIDDEGVAWDLWFDQRRHPFPGFDLSVCHDALENRLDLDCWRDFDDRVDWDEWTELVADVVCVPEINSGCEEVTLRVPMDAGFDGSRGRGVYSFAMWVDRFRMIAEDNEFDNFVGPVRVTVVPSEFPTEAPPPMNGESHSWLIEGGTSPRPYSMLVFPERAERPFTLSSQKSRGVLEFAPRYPGRVTVEVEQIGVFEQMVVEIRKVSTRQVLFEATGKGRLRLDGEIGILDLKDDRRLEVVVTPGQGTWGVRGTIEVEYPARASYRRTE